ncbi:hypothetical protein J4H92_06765 [Leucobacter weissii]|uniref:Uncharacterized protein n=1 Tax=Leucobacter weissii TaxID=1983706 RepID=A0A939MIP8_9MICO|nr:hypothetical protein [Leucobacter weissii]MBO1901653.1 hypothetical protein [Leucobacter weissii]
MVEIGDISQEVFERREQERAEQWRELGEYEGNPWGDLFIVLGGFAAEGDTLNGSAFETAVRGLQEECTANGTPIETVTRFGG